MNNEQKKDNIMIFNFFFLSNVMTLSSFYSLLILANKGSWFFFDQFIYSLLVIAKKYLTSALAWKRLF